MTTREPSRRYYDHVYPLGDLRPHITQEGKCWCHPIFDDEEQLVVHNAMDQRELYERGELRLH